MCVCVCERVYLCMHSVAHVSVSVPDEPAQVEAQGQEASPQQVTQGGQVRDGKVVRVHAPTPHPVDHPVCQVEEDHDLQQCSKQVEGNEDGCEGGVSPPQGVDGVEEDEVPWGNQQEKYTG